MRRYFALRRHKHFRGIPQYDGLCSPRLGKMKDSINTMQAEDLLPHFRRMRAFMISNGTSALSILPTLAIASHPKTGKAFTRWYAATVFRLGFTCLVLGTFAAWKKRFSQGAKESTDEKHNEPKTLEMLLRLLFIASPAEALATRYVLQRFARENVSWMNFLPLSFIFEILVDFGHYWAHRLLHANSFLYKWSGHKTHHAVHNPTVLATFNQDPIDIFLSNVVPVVGSLWLLERCGLHFSKSQMIFALGLKTYVEVAGHVGILDGHATSFPQCVWLPRIFGIELHTKDHDLHHTHGGKHNFSKRFTLFDKIFGTYRKLD